MAVDLNLSTRVSLSCALHWLNCVMVRDVQGESGGCGVYICPVCFIWMLTACQVSVGYRCPTILLYTAILYKHLDYKTGCKQCCIPHPNQHYIPAVRFWLFVADPLAQSPQKALEAIGSNLQKQYERWQPRARYKQTLDPTVEEVKKLCSSLRRNAKVPSPIIYLEL